MEYRIIRGVALGLLFGRILMNIALAVYTIKANPEVMESDDEDLSRITSETMEPFEDMFILVKHSHIASTLAWIVAFIYFK